MPSSSVAVRSLAFAVAGLSAAVALAQPAPSAPAFTVSFEPQSVEIAQASRGGLEGLVRSLAERGVRQIELRGYASGDDVSDARRLALARALSVRSYLIDQGVKARIEVNVNGAAARTAPRERVDVLVP
jgi:outer membrane protein OmpA-like peptidoglycan-associated protein